MRAVIFLSLCMLPVPWAWAQHPPNEIAVRVTYPNGRPVDLMPVFLLGDDYTQLNLKYTDAAGRCYFRGLSQGTFHIQIEPKGNEYYRQTFRVQIGDVMTSGGEKFILEVPLKPKDPGIPTGTPETSVFHQTIPPAAQRSFEQAGRALERSKADEAEKALKEAVRIFPDYYEALDALGSEYVRQKRQADALPLLQKALQVNPKGWHASYSLGAALCDLGRRQEGLTALRHAVDFNPRSANAYMRFGLELARDPASRQDAIAALVKAAGIAGKDLPDAFFTLASLYTAEQQYGAAADALERYVGAVPNAEPRQKEQYRKAIEQLRKKAR